MTMTEIVSKVLTIAGSDSGGGAGIQADLKTFQELDVYGMSVITAVTAQNTVGVQAVYPLPVEAVMQQLDSIGTDLTPNAIKTGMLFDGETIETVAKRIRQYDWSHIVVDPVMIAKGGASLLQKGAIESLRTKLLPLADVVTPNIPEAEVLADMSIRSLDDRKEAARRIREWGVDHVLIKGGHGVEEHGRVVDLLFDGSRFIEFSSTHVITKHTHGTGCTFAAVIAAELGKGSTIRDAANKAKNFIQCAIEDSLAIGNGHGPTNHWAYNRRMEQSLPHVRERIS